jgi:hypothetical protein
MNEAESAGVFLLSSKFFIYIFYLQALSATDMEGGRIFRMIPGEKLVTGAYFPEITFCHRREICVLL